MRVVVEALWPTFALIVLGALGRHFGFPGDEFWPPAVRLAYFVLLPVVICCELATATLTLEVLPMGAALAGGVLALAVPTLGARPWLGLGDRAFGSVFQGSIRFNTYVGLAMAPALAGAAGGSLAALAIAALVPLVNLLSVAVLARGRGAGAASWSGMARSLVTNPLLLACALGGALNWTGIGLPPGTGRTLDLLSRAALPLGLLTVGAGLEPRGLRAAAYPVVLASGLKLLALPAVTAGLCTLLDVEGTARAVAVLFAALPTAPAAYALARQLGGDAELMAGILTVQTLLATVTLPLAWTLLA